MNFLERVKQLCQNHQISLAELERQIGLSSGSVTKWKKSSPSIENVEKIADYFHVSIDYLLGRQPAEESYYQQVEDEEKDIQKQLERIIADLSNANITAFTHNAAELSPEARQVVLTSIKESLIIGQILSKTPHQP